MIALYAVFMKTQMDDLKTSVRDTLGFVQTSSRAASSRARTSPTPSRLRWI